MSEIKHGIAWSSDYEIGNAEVDAQHKRLFKLVSDLVVSCMEGRSTETLKETLDFLVDYTVQHFGDEESLQLQYGFPEYETHKQMHDDFKTKVSELVLDFLDSGSSEELSRDVNKVVVRWLTSHISREDKKIGVHIRKARM